MAFSDDVETIPDSDPEFQDVLTLPSASSAAEESTATNPSSIGRHASPFFRADASGSTRRPESPARPTSSAFQSASALLRAQVPLERSLSPEVQILSESKPVKMSRLRAQEVITIIEDDEPARASATFAPIAPPPRKKLRAQPAVPSLLSRTTSDSSLVSLQRQEGDQDDGSDVAPRKLDLSRFKFTSSTTLSRKPSRPEVLVAMTHPRSKSAPTPVTQTALAQTTLTGKAMPKKTKLSTTSDIVLPPNDRIRVLDSCPLCSVTWTVQKTAQTKATHLRKCARANNFDSEQVLSRVEEYIVMRSVEVETQRRQRELNRSVFDSTIGRGEGPAAMADVRVIGVESSGDEFSSVAIFDLQQSLKEAQKRDAPHKIVKIAWEIKDAQRLRRREQSEPAEPTQAPAPAGTGLLRDHYDGLTQDVAARAHAVLEGRSESRSAEATTAVGQAQPNFDRAGIDQVLDEEAEPPRATQEFQASSLAARYRASSSSSSSADEAEEVSSILLPMHANLSPTTKTSSMWRMSETAAARVNEASLVSSAPPSHRHSSLPADVPASPAHLLILSSPSLPPVTMTTTPSSTESLSSRVRHFNLASRRSLDSTPSRSPALLFRQASFATEDSPVRAQLARSVHSLAISDDRNEEGAAARSTSESDDALDGSPTKRKRGRPKGSKNKPKEIAAIVLSSDEETDGARQATALDGSSQITSSDVDDDEPLAKIVKRGWPPKKAKGAVPDEASGTTKKGRRKSSTPPVLTDPEDTASSDDIEGPDAWPVGMPRYDEWTTAALSAETEKYGFRPAKEKSVLVERMRAIWTKLHPASKSKKAKGGKKEATTAKRTRKKRTKADEGDVLLSKEEQQADALDRLRDALLADDTLWTRVLRYEPIHVDDFVELVKRNEIKIARQSIIKFLDDNCITFYSNDPLNGTRRRYK